MTNDSVDIQHGDVNDEHNNDENIYSLNHEDQIQEGVNIRISIINEAVNRAVLELSNSELFEGKHVDFAQILSNWQENYTNLFKSIVEGDKLTLDEALIFTLDDLSDVSLDLRSNPDEIDKEVIDQGKVRNEERFEAVLTSINTFIEKRNENPKVSVRPNKVKFKNAGIKPSEAGNYRDILDNYFGEIRMFEMDEFVQKARESGDEELQKIPKYTTGIGGTLAHIRDKDFKELNDHERYNVIQAIYALHEIKEERPEFEKPFIEWLAKVQNILPPGVFQDGVFNEEVFEKEIKRYIAKMVSQGVLSKQNPEQQFRDEINALKREAEKRITKDREYIDEEDERYENYAEAKRMEISDQINKLRENNASSEEMLEYFDQVSGSEYASGLLYYMGSLLPDAGMVIDGRSFALKEKGYVEQEEGYAAFQDKALELLLKRYQKEKVIDELEDRTGVDRYVDRYTNEKTRQMMRAKMIRDVITKGKVDPEFMDEMLRTDPSIARSAIIDIIQFHRDIPASFGVSFDIKFENIISSQEQYQRLLVPEKADMAQANEPNREELSLEEEIEFITDRFRETDGKLGQAADFSDREAKIAETLDTTKNHNSYERIMDEFRAIEESGNVLAMYRYGMDNVDEVDKLYSYITAGDTEGIDKNVLISFKNRMHRLSTARLIFKDAEAAAEDPKRKSELETTIDYTAGANPAQIVDLFMIADSEEGKDDPAIQMIREVRDRLLEQPMQVLKSQASPENKLEVLQKLAQPNLGSMNVVLRYIETSIHSGSDFGQDFKPEEIEVVSKAAQSVEQGFMDYQKERELVESVYQASSAYLDGDLSFSDYLDSVVASPYSAVRNFTTAVRDGVAETKYEEELDGYTLDVIEATSVVTDVLIRRNKEDIDIREFFEGKDKRAAADAISGFLISKGDTVRFEDNSFFEQLAEIDDTILTDVQKSLVGELSSGRPKPHINEITGRIVAARQKVIDAENSRTSEEQDREELFDAEKTDIGAIMQSGENTRKPKNKNDGEAR